MSSVWVANASPLIILAKANYLQLLTDLAPEVLLPDAVVSELLAGPPADPARQAIEKGWGKRVSVGNMPRVVLEWGLGPGETEVIAVALEHPNSTALLDDAQGRTCARTFGISVIGTLGVVLRAQKMGRVASATKVIQDLRTSGLFLDDQIIRDALRQTVGEEWDP